MASEIVMPQMGAEMEEGTVVRWIKQPGEFVTRGETIAEIETDKATVDLESFEEGFFLGAVIEDGTTVPVGTIVGYLGAEGEALPGGGPPIAAPNAEAAATPATSTPAPAPAPAGGDQPSAPAAASMSAPAAEAPAAPDMNETAGSALPGGTGQAAGAPVAAAPGEGSAGPPVAPGESVATMPSQTDSDAARPLGQPAATATDAAPAPPPPAATDRPAASSDAPRPVSPPAEKAPPAAEASDPVAASRDGTSPAVANGARRAASALSGATPSTAGGRPRVSPVARGMAEELGVDLGEVRGSGPDGRIMRRDVEEFARSRSTAPAAPPTQPVMAEAAPAPRMAPSTLPEDRAATVATAPTLPAPETTAWGATAEPAPEMVAAAPPTPASSPTATAPTVRPASPSAPETAEPAALPVQTPVYAGGVEPLSRMRQVIARRMSAAKREIPHYYVTMSVDMVEAMAFRKQLNATLTTGGGTDAADGNSQDARISVNDLIVKACALALEKYPRFNMSFTDDGYRVSKSVNIGIAVALDDGLIVPAVLNCQGKSLGTIAHEARDVAERARGGSLRQPEIADGTFTVSNLGMYGVETLIAIIQPGQSAILGVGTVEPRAVVRDGAVTARETMSIALSADHRVTNGAEGARFIAEIRDLLEHPLRLAL